MKPTPLEELNDTKAKMDKAFVLAFGSGPAIVVDEANKRLVIDTLWSLNRQGKGWVLTRKFGVPDEVREIKQVTDPDHNPEFVYVLVWKASRPLQIVLHALMSQWADMQTLAAIAEATGEPVCYDKLPPEPVAK